MLRSRKFHIVLLLVVAAGVYANSLGGEFVYDDKAMIVAYDLVKDIRNVPAAFVSATSLYGNVNYYRPLQTISYMTDYYLWGDLPFGFHLTNVLFHMTATLLVYVFLRSVFKNEMLAFVTALMFSVHPVHGTVVSYIAGRADAMLCVFMLACFIFYIKFRHGARNMGYYVCSMLFFILALLTKEFAMIIPVALMLFDGYARHFTPLEETKKGKYDSAAFWIILALYLLFRVRNMGFFVEGAVPPFPLENRLITAPYSIAQYLRMIVFPVDLHIGREPWVARSFLDARIVASSLIVASLGLGAFIARNREKTVWFGICWFLIMIFPSLNIITPLFYTVAENWLYIPSIGLFLAMAALAQRAYGYLERADKTAGKYTVAVCTGLFIFVMGGVTVTYNTAWKDEISLGMNTLKYNPREFKIYNNIGVVYLGRGELDKAERSFKKCLEIKPDTGMAYFNLYRIYIARGKHAEAVRYLDKARELDPRRVGILVQKMGIKD